MDFTSWCSDDRAVLIWQRGIQNKLKAPPGYWLCCKGQPKHQSGATFECLTHAIVNCALRRVLMPAGNLAGCQMPWAFSKEILGLASHSSLLLAAWDQGIPSTHCSTGDSGFAPCLCRAERHHLACTLHLRSVCDPSLTAFPNPSVNIIYEGCLEQNGLCNHIPGMFFQAL